ncbi:MAG: HD domain-containing protein [Clostridia bacterium]|nr:HD domain-containing protein [Clostridia bacterium]
MSLSLGDATGEITARAFEEARLDTDALEAGQAVRIKGVVTEWSGQLQVKIEAIERAEENIDPHLLLPCSSRPRHELETDLIRAVETVQHPHLRALLAGFFSDPGFAGIFLTAPASKRHHHAYLGGLAEHTLAVADIASRLSEVYRCDRELLVTCALLHDIGKVKELRYDTCIDYTVEGRLLGHIILGYELVSTKINQEPSFPETLRLKVLHMILSHHGEYRWQSPKRPKFLEAQLLHRADLIDAERAMFRNALQPGFTWSRELERFIYTSPDE